MKINIKTIELADVFMWDAPDFADAYIAYAEWEDGEPLTADECCQATEDLADVVNELAQEVAWEG